MSSVEEVTVQNTQNSIEQMPSTAIQCCEGIQIRQEYPKMKPLKIQKFSPEKSKLLNTNEYFEQFDYFKFSRSFIRRKCHWFTILCCQWWTKGGRGSPMVSGSEGPPNL